MAKQRDYKREYQTSVARGDSIRRKSVGTKIPVEVYEMFVTKAEHNNTTPSALIREWIEEYVFD